MNKFQLLHYLLSEVDSWVENANMHLSKKADSCAKNIDDLRLTDEVLNDHIFELSSRRESKCIYPPKVLPATPDQAVTELRGLYKDDVTNVSLVLHRHFPDRFIFYRVSKLEDEVHRGLEYFSETEPDFVLEFSRVRRNNFDEYLAVNDALLKVARRWWPDADYLQPRIERFLYHNLAPLFVETSDFNRYWICNTHHEYWENRFEYDGEPNVIEWSGRKDMQEGDLVFLYCSAPVKAITDVYQVHEPPWFDAYGAWDGFWVKLAHVCSIPGHIPFGKMRQDQVLSEWSVTRRNFQGVVTANVPHAFYNRLLEFMPGDLREEYNLAPEPISEISGSGQFATEEEFENAAILPLLKNWGLNLQRQFCCKCHFGTQVINGYVDFLVSNDLGNVTLFEDKMKIVGDNQLRSAVSQAKSYALMLGLPSFVVASPEGLKLYSLNRAREELVAEMLPNSEKADEDRFLGTLLQLQPK